MSEVKDLILELLRNKEWVSSKELLKKTKQKYFDRRIRELRDEQGYDIINEFRNGEPHYKLNSTKLNPTKERTYLSKKDRNKLLDQKIESCPLCMNKFDKVRKISYDHRVPLIKGGQGVIENFQIICHECNNQKRSQCRHCELDCNKCFLAFPEKYPPAILLQLDNILYEKLLKVKSELKISPVDYITKLIEDHFEK